MTATVVSPRPRTLRDVIPGARTRDVVLVVGFALFTALCAQISIPLGFTPVPITGQTFAVLLAGGTLGAARGGASQLLYVLLGAVGLPFYADGDGGWTAATGATGGYLVGFVVAAVLVGWMAEHRQDRGVRTAVPAFLTGTILIYGLGALWLADQIDVPLTAGPGEPRAIAYGVAPFLVGDILKALLAGCLLPAAGSVACRRCDQGLTS